MELQSYSESGSKFVSVGLPLRFYDFREVLEAAHGRGDTCQECYVSVLTLEWGQAAHVTARVSLSSTPFAICNIRICNPLPTARSAGPAKSAKRPSPATLAAAEELLITAPECMFGEDEAADAEDGRAAKFLVKTSRT